MIIKNALLFSFAALTALFGSGAVAARNPVLSSYYVEGLPNSVMRQLFEKYDIETPRGKGYEVVLPVGETKELLKLAPNAQLIEKDIRDIFRRLDKKKPGWRAQFRDFDSVQRELQDIVQKYPQLASVENYGTTEEGQPNLVLRLATKTKEMASKPEVLITSLTHGNELQTVEVVMDFVQWLLKGYGSDARATQMMDKHVLYFIPVVCPDGYIAQERWSDGVDPNRNYPYPDEPDRKPIASIKNKIDWFGKHHIAGALSVHGYLSTVMYPWSHKNEPPDSADVSRFEEIGKVMANDTGYNFGQIANVFGIAQGASDDYMYWKGHTLSFGYEIGGYSLENGPGSYNYGGDQEAFKHFVEYF